MAGPIYLNGLIGKFFSFYPSTGSVVSIAVDSSGAFGMFVGLDTTAMAAITGTIGESF